MTEDLTEASTFGQFYYIIGIGGCGSAITAKLIEGVAEKDPPIILDGKRPIDPIKRYTIWNTGINDFLNRESINRLAERIIDEIGLRELNPNYRVETLVSAYLSIVEKITSEPQRLGAGMLFIDGERIGKEFVKVYPKDEWLKQSKLPSEAVEFVKDREIPGSGEEAYPSIMKYRLLRRGFSFGNEKAILIISGLGQGTGSGTTYQISQKISELRNSEIGWSPFVFNIAILNECTIGVPPFNQYDLMPRSDRLINSNVLLGLGHLRLFNSDNPGIVPDEIKRCIFLVTNQRCKIVISHLGITMVERTDHNDVPIDIRFNPINDLIVYWFIRMLINCAYDSRDLINFAKSVPSNYVPILVPACYIPRNPSTDPRIWISNAVTLGKLAESYDEKNVLVQMFASNPRLQQRIADRRSELIETVAELTGIGTQHITYRPDENEFCKMANFNGVLLLFNGVKLKELDVLIEDMNECLRESPDNGIDAIDFIRTRREKIGEALREISSKEIIDGS